jgi:hypothetical protein
MRSCASDDPIAMKCPAASCGQLTRKDSKLTPHLEAGTLLLGLPKWGDNTPFGQGPGLIFARNVDGLFVGCQEATRLVRVTF